MKEGLGVPTSKYGTGQAKTLEGLLEEVQKGESTLTAIQGQHKQGWSATRLVHVLNLYLVNQDGMVLTEVAQQLPDGRRRERYLPVSEKLLPAEDWAAAVPRAVAEELGSVLDGVDGWQDQLQIDTSSYHQVVETSPSRSYPSLQTQYVFHRVRGNLPCLPGGPFQTEEERPNGRLISFWEWLPDGAANGSGPGTS